MSIELSREQMQTVLNALAQRPYAEVAEVIETILKQVNPPQELTDAGSED